MFRTSLLGVACALLAALGPRAVGHGGDADVTAHRCLAFAAGEADSHIYLVKEDGTGLRRLTPGFSPSWSADGRQIAFRRADRLYLMGADGSNEHEWRLPGNPEGLVWSRDGRRLAYSGGASDNEYTAGDIYVINPDGTKPRRVSGRPGYTNEFPSWSANGRRITFASTRGARDDERALWVVNVDGKRRRLLSSAGRHSSWRPGRGTIVFSSARRARTGLRRLWVVKPNGTALRPLRSLAGEFPAWSPDGRELAFSAPLGGIRITNVRGLSGRRIVAKLGFAGWPTWRPGGCS